MNVRQKYTSRRPTSSAGKDSRLPDAQPDRVRIGLDQCLHDGVHVLNAVEKYAFPEEAMIVGYIEALAVQGE